MKAITEKELKKCWVDDGLGDAKDASHLEQGSYFLNNLVELFK